MTSRANPASLDSNNKTAISPAALSKLPFIVESGGLEEGVLEAVDSAIRGCPLF